MQHLSPSRLEMAAWVAASGLGGGQPSFVTDIFVNYRVHIVQEIPRNLVGYTLD